MRADQQTRDEFARIVAEAVDGLNPSAEVLLSMAEVASIVRRPVATLRWWRHEGVGPRGFRVGGRRVMYRKSDVVAWLEGQYAAESETA